MVKRVPPEAALLMLHWQNSVCDPKGVWGKNLCRQIEKNNAIRNAQSVLATARNRGMLTIFVTSDGVPAFPNCQRTSITHCCKGPRMRTRASWGPGRSMSSMPSGR